MEVIIGDEVFVLKAGDTLYLQYLVGKGSVRSDLSVRIWYSDYLVYFQYVDSFGHPLIVTPIYIVSFAYARLRSAQRIKCPLERHFLRPVDLERNKRWDREEYCGDLPLCRRQRANQGGLSAIRAEFFRHPD